ncbi:MAG: site-specific DNA-methyltransferase [Candidatus Methanofastidiosia archaeon]|jgi:site-specific DNA-methyltransferase (adenine-specific)
MFAVSGKDRDFTNAACIAKRGVLFNCDCEKLFSVIKDSSIDMIFCDPPFNLDKNYGTEKFNDSIKDEEYLKWSFSWMDECVRVLKPGGSLFIYNIPKWCIYLGAYLNQRLEFRHWVAICMKNTFPRGRKLYPAHYGLLYYTKGKPTTFHTLRTPIPVCRHCGGEIKDYGGHRNKLNPKGLTLTDFWDDTSPVRHKKFKKRSANELKPIIPRRAILMSTNPGDIILDPFGGGGSTYIQAELNKRFWIGSEIGDCAPIIENLSEHGKLVSGEIDKVILDIFEHYTYEPSPEIVSKRYAALPIQKSLDAVIEADS